MPVRLGNEEWPAPADTAGRLREAERNYPVWNLATTLAIESLIVTGAQGLHVTPYPKNGPPGGMVPPQTMFRHGSRTDSEGRMPLTSPALLPALGGWGLQAQASVSREL